MEVYRGYDTHGEPIEEVTRSYLEKLERALYLLKPIKELLERCDESPIVLDALSDVMLHYDDAECDGHCLLEDINAVLEEEE
jgi:hypothetical protein